MKVLFTTQPAHGHFHPLVPLAHALEQAGHEVAFACSRSFCPVVETAGLRTFPVGLDFLSSELEKAFPQIATMTPAERTAFVPRYLFALVSAQHTAADLLVLARQWQFDVVVREFWEHGGYIAAEALNVPHVTHGINLFKSMETNIIPNFGRQLDGLRAAFGLSADPNLITLFRYMYLHYVPPSFQPVSEAGDTAHAIRPSAFDLIGAESLPSWVDDLPKQPVVYATLGTVFNKVRKVFDAILVGMNGEPASLILTVGRTQNPASFGSQPDNIHIEQYIPQTLLFPRCDMVITHGGYNTIMSALSHGLPLLIVPIAADHHDNTRHCVELGAAHVVNADQISAEAIRDGVRTVLGDPRYRENAQRIQKEMAAMPDDTYAVQLLENLVAANGTQLQ